MTLTETRPQPTADFNRSPRQWQVEILEDGTTRAVDQFGSYAAYSTIKEAMTHIDRLCRKHEGDTWAGEARRTAYQLIVLDKKPGWLIEQSAEIRAQYRAEWGKVPVFSPPPMYVHPDEIDRLASLHRDTVKFEQMQGVLA